MFWKKQTATDMVLAHQQELIQDLYKKLSEGQLRLFRLASKTGYEWKNNRWVKKGVYAQ